MDTSKEIEAIQGNLLIESRRRWTVVETRLFYIGLQKINPHISENDKFYDTDFQTLFVPYSDLTDMFGQYFFQVNRSGFEKVVDGFFDKKIEIRDGDYWKKYHVFSMMEFVPLAGNNKKTNGNKLPGIYFRFDDMMKPYILDLIKKPFTKIAVKEVWMLSTVYSVRLFELIVQYKNTVKKERRLTVEEIREYLGIPSEAYEGRSDNFKRFVIVNPLKEINKKTGYKIAYESIKTGRKITAYKFTIMKIPAPIDKPKLTEVENIIWELNQHGVHQAQKLINKYGVERCRHNLELALKRMNDSAESIKKPAAYIVRAIKDDWYSISAEAKNSAVGEPRPVVNRDTQTIAQNDNSEPESAGDVLARLSQMDPYFRDLYLRHTKDS